jgi:hypothetical protein
VVVVASVDFDGVVVPVFSVDVVPVRAVSLSEWPSSYNP